MDLKSNTLLIVLSVLVLGTMGFNVYLQNDIGQALLEQKIEISNLSLSQTQTTQTSTGSSSSSAPNVLSFEEFIPNGIPAVYGAGLGVTYDKPVESLEIMKYLDGDLYPNGTIKFADLTPEQQQDYILIGTSISCEFCCGAKAVTSPDGTPACGCAHSAAMRGLAMHILINHPGEMTNDEILQELTNWKTMFFPKQMYQRALGMQAAGQSSNTQLLDQIPDMVGGC